jgi:hypothetical protein
VIDFAALTSSSFEFVEKPLDTQDDFEGCPEANPQIINRIAGEGNCRIFLTLMPRVAAHQIGARGIGIRPPR